MFLTRVLLLVSTGEGRPSKSKIKFVCVFRIFWGVYSIFWLASDPIIDLSIELFVYDSCLFITFGYWLLLILELPFTGCFLTGLAISSVLDPICSILEQSKIAILYELGYFSAKFRIYCSAGNSLYVLFTASYSLSTKHCKPSLRIPRPRKWYITKCFINGFSISSVPI